MRPTPGRQVLFNPGPVNLDPEITRHLFDIELCHRQEAFEQVLAHVLSQLT